MKALHDVMGAAQLLAVSPWTIRAYIRQGKLRPIRIGRLIRIDELELERFITNAKFNPTSHTDPGQETKMEEPCPTN